MTFPNDLSAPPLLWLALPKPLVFAETDGYVAISTEERAITQVFGAAPSVYEPPAREVRVWLR